MCEIFKINAGLEADQVIREQGLCEPGMVGRCTIDLVGGKGDVQEKADPLAVAELAQFGGQWNEVIIVDPDRRSSVSCARSNLGKAKIYLGKSAPPVSSKFWVSNLIVE